MKKLVVLVVIVAALVIFRRPLLEKGRALAGAADAEPHVRARVTAVLEGMHKGGSGTDMQTAICQWDRAVPIIRDLGELGRASDAFDAFRASKGLTGNIGSYEVSEITFVEGSSPRTANVKLKIDGQSYQWTVPEGQRISWAN